MKKLTFLFLACVVVFLNANPLLAQQNGEDAKFQKFLDSYFDELWKFHPTLGTLAGSHKYDNKLEDLSTKNLEKRHEALDTLNQELVANLDFTKLSPELQIDHEIMRDALDRELVKHENLLPWEYNPMFYNEVFMNCIRSLLTEEFAPLDERAKNATDRLKDLPKLIKQAKENLKTPAQLYTETAIQQFPAILEFYKNELPGLIGQTPAAHKTKLESNLAKVIPALDDYYNFLQNELLPRSTGNFRLGEVHRRLVRTTFSNNIPLEELVARATADVNNIVRDLSLVSIPFFQVMYPEIELDNLQRSENEIRTLLIRGVHDKIKGEHVSKEEFLNKLTAVKDEIKSFIQETDLIDLPDAELPLVEMPLEKQGITWTLLTIPKLYENSGEYSLQVAPLNNDLTDEQITSLLEEYNEYFLPFYVCRKVYPGQFVPCYFTRINASLARKAFPNIPLIKGWPIFVEEMLIIEGLGNYDLRLRFNQLKLRLKAAIDFILDFNIHESAMSKEDAIAYMTRVGYQTEAEAERNWNRIVLKPIDAAYAYVGFQEFLDMQKHYKQMKGDSYNQKDFLKELLNYGALPLRHLQGKLK